MATILPPSPPTAATAAPTQDDDSARHQRRVFLKSVLEEALDIIGDGGRADYGFAFSAQ